MGDVSGGVNALRQAQLRAGSIQRAQTRSVCVAAAKPHVSLHTGAVSPCCARGSVSVPQEGQLRQGDR